MRNLEDLVKATCLRRTKAQVKGLLSLPPRLDQVEWIDLSPPDRELYEYFKAKTASVASGMATQKGYRKTEDNIICLINILRRICGHGEVLLPESALRAWRERQNDSIDWQTMQKWCGKQCDLCGQDAAAGDESSSASSPDARFLCQHVLCSACSMERAEEEEEEGGSDSAACPICRAGSVQVKTTALPETTAGVTVKVQRRPGMWSNKILALVRNIQQEQRSQPEHPGTKRWATFDLSRREQANHFTASCLVPGPRCWIWRSKPSRTQDFRWLVLTARRVSSNGLVPYPGLARTEDARSCWPPLAAPEKGLLRLCQSS